MSENELPRVDCPFCEWRGANNQYPDHLAECSAKVSTDDTRAGQALLADGAGFTPKPGALVVDRDDDSPQPSVALVLDTVNVRADRYRLDALDGRTVAELNPEYPADDDVAIIAFLDDLDDALGDYKQYTTARLREHTRTADIRTYSYPAGRLRPAEGHEPAPRAGGEA